MGDSKYCSQTDGEGNSGGVTISEPADSLALSKGAVSKALNGCCDVSGLTKARVAEAADRLGHRPFSHAWAIRTGRAKSIGQILRADGRDGHGFFLRDFLAGMSKSASAHGWMLTVTGAGSHEDFRGMAARLVEQRALVCYGDAYDWANEKEKSHGRRLPENHHSTLTSETVS